MLREYVQIIFGSLQAGSPRRKLSLKLPEAYMIWITEHDVVSNVIFFWIPEGFTESEHHFSLALRREFSEDPQFGLEFIGKFDVVVLASACSTVALLSQIMGKGPILAMSEAL